MDETKKDMRDVARMGSKLYIYRMRRDCILVEGRLIFTMTKRVDVDHTWSKIRARSDREERGGEVDVD